MNKKAIYVYDVFHRQCWLWAKLNCLFMEKPLKGACTSLRTFSSGRPNSLHEGAFSARIRTLDSRNHY